MKEDAALVKVGAGSVIDYEAENARLRAENLELRRVNELLREASAFFASELAPTPGNDRIHRYVSGSLLGYLFICATLAHHRQGGFMTARGYRAAKKRLPSVRSVRDSELIPVIIGIHQDNYGVYGVRKDVARHETRRV